MNTIYCRNDRQIKTKWYKHLDQDSLKSTDCVGSTLDSTIIREINGVGWRACSKFSLI